MFFLWRGYGGIIGLFKYLLFIISFSHWWYGIQSTANNEPQTLFSNFSLILKKHIKPGQQRWILFKWKPAFHMKHTYVVRYDIRPAGPKEHLHGPDIQLWLCIRSSLDPLEQQQLSLLSLEPTPPLQPPLLKNPMDCLENTDIKPSRTWGVAGCQGSTRKARATTSNFRCLIPYQLHMLSEKEERRKKHWSSGLPSLK